MPRLINPKPKTPLPVVPPKPPIDPVDHALQQLQIQNQGFLEKLGEVLTRQGKKVITGKVSRNKDGLIDSIRLEVSE